MYQLHQWILLKMKRNHSPKHKPSWGKPMLRRKIAITPATQPIKHPVTKSTKIRSKDKRSPIQTPTSTDSSPNKKTLKDKQNPTPKPKIQETENTEPMNKFRILKKWKPRAAPN